VNTSASQHGLATSQGTVFAGFIERVSLAGAVVAEIGGTFPVERLLEQRVAKWTCIDPRPPEVDAPDDARARGVREVVVARAEAMPLPDESVDAVFSSNAFQFLDVRATLAEVRRVLRPGGILYAHFGPIWSAVDGHQLEYVAYEGRELAFWRDTLLPPWAHLAYEREQLRAVLRSGLPEPLADLLVWHVHDAGTINRMFFEDYVAAALGSGLVWEQVAASDRLDYAIVPPPSYDPERLLEVDVARLAATISDRRGSPTQLGIRDVLMVLHKPSTPTS
jgi:SAM-dependent methyltransferase